MSQRFLSESAPEPLARRPVGLIVVALIVGILLGWLIYSRAQAKNTRVISPSEAEITMLRQLALGCPTAPIILPDVWEMAEYTSIVFCTYGESSNDAKILITRLRLGGQPEQTVLLKNNPDDQIQLQVWVTRIRDLLKKLPQTSEPNNINANSNRS